MNWAAKAARRFMEARLLMCRNLNRSSIPLRDRFGWQPDELVAILGSHQGRHWGQVHCLAYCAATRRLASGGADNLIRLWNAEPWNAEPLRELAALEGHTDSVESVAFAPDGSMLASASRDGTIRFWAPTEAAPRSSIAYQSAARRNCCIALSPDGRFLAFGGADAVVLLWEVVGVELGQQIRLFGHSQSVLGLAFSPDGKVLASSGGDRTIRLWEISGPIPRERIAIPLEDDVAYPLVFAPDGDTLAAYGFESVRLWNLDRQAWRVRAESKRFWEGGESTALAFSPNGRLLVVAGGEKVVQLWDVTGPVPTERDFVDWQTGDPVCVAFVSDWTLASGSGDGIVRLLDVTRPPREKPTEPSILPGHRTPVRAMAFSGDGKTLLSSDGERVVQWCLEGEKPEQVTVKPVPAGETQAFSPDSRWLAACTWNGEVVLWNLSSSEPRQEQLAMNEPFVEEVAFSSNGKVFAARGYAALHLYDVSTDAPRPLKRFEGGWRAGLVFSPIGERLAAIGCDGILRIWDITRGLFQGEVALGEVGVANVRLMAFTGDGRQLIVVGSDRRVWFIDLAGAEPLVEQFELGGYVPETRSVLVLSSDGETLVAAGEDGRINFWDTSDLSMPFCRWRFPGAVHSAAFAPQGDYLATGNGDGTIYVLSTPKPVSRRIGTRSGVRRCSP